MKMNELKEELDAVNTINDSKHELVKMKARAIGKENKHRQKFMPAGSPL